MGGFFKTALPTFFSRVSHRKAPWKIHAEWSKYVLPCLLKTEHISIRIYTVDSRNIQQNTCYIFLHPAWTVIASYQSCNSLHAVLQFLKSHKQYPVDNVVWFYSVDTIPSSELQLHYFTIRSSVLQLHEGPEILQPVKRCAGFSRLFLQ